MHRSHLPAYLILLALCLSPLGSLARDPKVINLEEPRPVVKKADDELAPTTVYTNSQVVGIPDDVYNGTLASMVCTNINTISVVPPGSVVFSVSITANINHTFIGDLTMKLRAPDGAVLTVLNRPGSTAPDDGSDAPVGDSTNWGGSSINFGDGFGPEAETMGATLADGQNICTDDGICNHDPTPDTAAVPPSTFSAFRNMQAGGVWTLCVGDSALLDTGTLNSWSLNLVSAHVFQVNPGTPIPDDGYVGGFGGVGMGCSTIAVPTSGLVQAAFLSVDISHTWVGDLTLKLRSPSGTVFTVLNRPGSNAADDGGGAVGNNANWIGPLSFGDGFGPEAETMGFGLTTDQVICTSNGICEHDPSPDTAGGPATFAAAFNGQTSSTNWTLCAGDSALGDVGMIRSWRLALVLPLAPTAANVGISGRVFSPLGSSISKARVKLVDSSGNARVVLTNPFGSYAFDEVEVGQSYLVSVEAKGYTFEPRTITVVDEVSNLDFVGQAGFVIGTAVGSSRRAEDGNQ